MASFYFNEMKSSAAVRDDVDFSLTNSPVLLPDTEYVP
jgi:hypothetical protein